MFNNIVLVSPFVILKIYWVKHNSCDYPWRRINNLDNSLLLFCVLSTILSPSKKGFKRYLEYLKILLPFLYYFFFPGRRKFYKWWVIRKISTYYMFFYFFYFFFFTFFFTFFYIFFLLSSPALISHTTTTSTNIRLGIYYSVTFTKYGD